MNKLTNKDIPCDWRLVKLDQTSYCGPDWVTKHGIKECGIYALVDASLHIHICSLTPSLEVWPMFGYADFVSYEAAEKDEGMAEMELLNTEEACSYYGTDLFDDSPWRPVTKYVDIPEQEEGETDEDYRRRVADECREHFAGNPVEFE